MHISGHRRSKHHQHSTRRHPERQRNSETVAGKGRKRAKFWAVRRRGVQWRGGPAQTSNIHNNHNRNNAKPGTSGAPPALPSKVLGLQGLGTTTHDNTQQHKTTTQQQHKTTTQHNNTTTTQNNNTKQQHKTTTTTTPENFDKTLKHQNWPKSVKTLKH